MTLPGGGTARVRVGAESGVENPAELGVRPEHIVFVDPQDESAALSGVVGIVEHLGNSTLLYVDTPAGQLIVEGKGNLVVRMGEPVGLSLNEAHTHLFGASGATL